MSNWTATAEGLQEALDDLKQDIAWFSSDERRGTDGDPAMTAKRLAEKQALEKKLMGLLQHAKDQNDAHGT